MGTFTKIGEEIAHIVKSDFVAFWKFFNEFDFVILTVIACPIDSLRFSGFAFNHGELTRDDVAHFLFDFREVGVRNFSFAKIDIVIKPLINSWTNAKFGLRV